ncbi:hypothetical protein D3C75_1368950 [compost metagenome]
MLGISLDHNVPAQLAIYLHHHFYFVLFQGFAVRHGPRTVVNIPLEPNLRPKDLSDVRRHWVQNL